MVYDFHTHTMLSDGSLSPSELIRRAFVLGYQAVALTDHVGPGNCELVVGQVLRECQGTARHWSIFSIAGVEITHVPAAEVASVARLARQCGAQIVVVHGQTLVEPVEEGTNLAAVLCPDVDVLAHPGLLSEEEARLAAENGVFVEISARKGHSLGNGRTVQIARAAGTRLLVNSDCHDPSDLLSAELALRVAQGAGLRPDELQEVLEENPRRLVERISRRTGSLQT